MNDFRSVVLSSPQFMRRWAICNPSHSITSFDNAHTRKEALRLVTAAHTIGGVSEMEFTFSESPSCVRSGMCAHESETDTLVRMHACRSNVTLEARLRPGHGDGRRSQLGRSSAPKYCRNT
jgi:hypothetical protein